MGHREPVSIDPSDLEDIAALQAKAKDVCLTPLIAQLEQQERYFRKYALTQAAADAWAATRQALQNALDAQEALNEAQRLLMKQHPDYLK